MGTQCASPTGVHTLHVWGHDPFSNEDCKGNLRCNIYSCAYCQHNLSPACPPEGPKALLTRRGDWWKMILVIRKQHLVPLPFTLMFFGSCDHTVCMWVSPNNCRVYWPVSTQFGRESQVSEMFSSEQLCAKSQASRGRPFNVFMDKTALKCACHLKNTRRHTGTQS